jgi:hypothetical protein
MESSVMPRSITIMLVSALLLSGAQAAPIPKERQQPTLYHATRVGDTLIYDHGNVESREAITAVEKQNGWLLIRYEHTLVLKGQNKELIDSRTIAVSEKGVFEPRSSVHLEKGELLKKWLDEVEPRDWYLQVPVKSGDGWEVTLQGDRKCEVVKMIYTVHGPEKVTVPAGTYQALRVEMCCTFNGDTGVPETTWYAPGVGLVKRTNGKNTTVLKSFTPGKE